MEDLRHARQHTGRDPGDMLALHSIQCDLDEVDAFVSHSWDDDFEQRYVALRAWAMQFESEHGRTPIIWLDKACIDQFSIEESLKCLPIFLSHCESFVVLGGPVWSTRLWCVIELFTFLRVGRNTNSIVFLPLQGRLLKRGVSSDLFGQTNWSGEECQAAEDDQDLWSSVNEFDVRETKCYAADRDLLLGAIESGYSTLDHFNVEMRKVLAAAVRTAHFRSWAGSSAGSPSSSVTFGSRVKPAKLRWQGVMQMAWRDLELEEQSGKKTQGVAAGSAPTVATVTTLASSGRRRLQGDPPLHMDDASGTDDASATDDFTAPEFETRDATSPDGEDPAVA